MSDEEIMNLDPATIVVGDPIDGSDDDANADSDDSTSSDDDSDPGDTEGEAGTDSSDDSADDDDDGEDTEAADDDEDPDKSGSDSEDSDDSSEDDQSSDKDASEDDDEDKDSGEVDFEAAYKELMAPFKAAKRQVTLGNIGDARRLMQMGVDYSQKMQAIKPHQRVLRTLEKAQLLDLNKINFLIDLSKNEPNAIKKLLRDNEIDPLTLDLKDGEDYTPTDHAPDEESMALDDVLATIKDSSSFVRTVEITTGMDKASKNSLKANPQALAIINAHVEAGVYDQVADRVASERLLGKLVGVSDLDAYYQTGDAMYKAGELGELPPADDTSSTSEDTSSDSAQPGSKGKKKASLKKRKRAAGRTKGGPGGGKTKIPDFANMSDQDIEDFDEKSLSSI